jgi:hypothetical protein
MRAELTDPEDAHVRKARLMVGYPCNVAKKLRVYLGHEGNNGKYYDVTGNISALTPGPLEKLDVSRTTRRCCALSRRRPGRASIGLKLASSKLKALTGGNDTECAGGLYQNPRKVDIENKTARADEHTGAASERVFVLEVQQDDRGTERAASTSCSSHAGPEQQAHRGAPC